MTELLTLTGMDSSYQYVIYFHASNRIEAERLCFDIYDRSAPLIKESAKLRALDNIERDAYQSRVNKVRAEYDAFQKERDDEIKDNPDEDPMVFFFKHNDRKNAMLNKVRAVEKTREYVEEYPTGAHYEAHEINTTIGWDDNREKCVQSWMDKLFVDKVDTLMIFNGQ